MFDFDRMFAWDDGYSLVRGQCAPSYAVIELALLTSRGSAEVPRE